MNLFKKIFQSLSKLSPVVLVLALAPLAASAAASMQSSGFEACAVDGFYQTIDGRRSFGETEVLAQNHAVGLYRGEPLTLEPWISISDQATLGVDQHGNVVQVLTFTDRHGIARQVVARLSHGVEFRTLFLRGDGQLFALDKAGELHIFSWNRWRSNQAAGDIEWVKSLWKKSLCGLNGVALAATVVQTAITGQIPFEYLIGAMMGNIGLTMTHVTLAARKYEVANEATNGFVATGVKLDSPAKYTRYIWSEDQTHIRDFELKLVDGQEASLIDGLTRVDSELLSPEAKPEDYDLNCDHLLLPRGLSEDTWETSWKKRG